MSNMIFKKGKIKGSIWFASLEHGNDNVSRFVEFFLTFLLVIGTHK